jgi:two-component system, chemotaxis family, sensor kinase CheA
MIPAELLERFRLSSLERVGRIEAAWNRLLAGSEQGATQHMLREVHTLKGDASVAGATDVQQLCQKLEDLLEAVDERPLDIADDLEVVVTMAMQFIGMLLRVRQAAGIDLEGFVRQVDDVLRETRTLPLAQRRLKHTSLREIADAPSDRLSDATRQRLAIAATTVFLEYLSARGTTSRGRLRGAWTALRDELGRAQAAELAPLFERHVASAIELARRLGKQIEIDLAFADVRIEPRVAEAVDIAMLHVIRNAIDHGIELPADRARGGKAEQGRVRVRIAPRDGSVDITIEDDGGGIDFAAIRRIALANQLIDPARAADEAALLELVYAPGFSTKSSVTDLSGRGVGMDAAKSALARVGGAIRIATSPRGTAVTVTVPTLVRHVAAYQFLAPSATVSLAVSARWTPSIDVSPHAVDPLAAIQLAVAQRQTSIEPPPTSRALTLRLRWGFLEAHLRAATEPRLVTAERICSTPDDHAIEVVTVEGQETLLLRPEHIAELAVTRGRTAVGR